MNTPLFSSTVPVRPGPLGPLVLSSGTWQAPWSRHGRARGARRDRLCDAAHLVIATWSRRGWASRSCRSVWRHCDYFSDRRDRYPLYQNSRVGWLVRTALTLPGQLLRLLFPSSRFDHFWGRASGGRRDMVATPRGVTTWSLSRRANPSRLGGRRFKTEVVPHSPPLALSLILLPSSSCLELPCDFSSVLGARSARAEVVPSRSCRGHARGAWSEEEVAIPM
ncbi:hypothetical protein Taro_055506 [Colocasia esculenta]|uniref:Uncharacterized protein n=1 Tax=Colocasia esculenta TaxID=4460 RepID=A0A843XRH1_COLES|nr:hypothetical protein [Colocasia esculenta]